MDCRSIVHLAVGLFGLIAFLPVPARLPAGTNINGTCPFGKVEQTGRVLTVSGGSWTAAGDLRGGDKVVVLFWTLGDRGAIGVYQVVDRELVGEWAWADQATFEDGILESEVLHREQFTIVQVPPTPLQ